MHWAYPSLGRRLWASDARGGSPGASRVGAALAFAGSFPEWSGETLERLPCRQLLPLVLRSFAVRQRPLDERAGELRSIFRIPRLGQPSPTRLPRPRCGIRDDAPAVRSSSLARERGSPREWI